LSSFTHSAFSGRPIAIGISMRLLPMLIWHPFTETIKRIKTNFDFATAVGYYTQMCSLKTDCCFYHQQFAFCLYSSTGTTMFVFSRHLHMHFRPIKQTFSTSQLSSWKLMNEELSSTRPHCRPTILPQRRSLSHRRKKSSRQPDSLTAAGLEWVC